MTTEAMRLWAEANPVLSSWLLFGGALILNAAAFWIARNLIARGLIYLAGRTETKLDDTLVRYIRPYRLPGSRRCS